LDDKYQRLEWQMGLAQNDASGFVCRIRKGISRGESLCMRLTESEPGNQGKANEDVNGNAIKEFLNF